MKHFPGIIFARPEMVRNVTRERLGIRICHHGYVPMENSSASVACTTVGYSSPCGKPKKYPLTFFSGAGPHKNPKANLKPFYGPSVLELKAELSN